MATLREIPIFDRDRALARMDNDVELFKEIVQIYFSEVPEQTAGMATALKNSDRVQIERLAHSLKSSSGNVGASLTSEIARQIEDGAREKSIEVLSELFTKMQSEFEKFKIEINASQLI